MDLGFSGKAALITGGSRGLGRATALTLADEGCDIAIAARTPETLEAAAAEIADKNVRAHAIQADVTVPEDIVRMVESVKQTFGRLDALVANAGGTQGGALLEATDADWQATLDINLMHAVRTVRAAVPIMRASGGGSVVIISSISGITASVPAQYGVAKAAEIFLARCLSLELAQYNIRVNCVAPGSIMFEGGGWGRRAVEMPEVMREFANSQFPYKRLGKAREVADAVTFLCSPRSSWIVGTTLAVDGAQQGAGLWSVSEMPGPQV
ncbi:MAG: SDR family NAD(P)-dependent oxidoreductase [Chloroflexi bacterium]|nr:SDR family NAD(P)-dependent oxidoreductase [Chloroflexota bacterium]MCY3938500.1 SDR family NAD(P)-dependent oxidoreductase [Chloroflexota bacterium]